MKTNIERLAILENETKNISRDIHKLCKQIAELDGKFDAAIIQKADRVEVRIINEKVSDIDKNQSVLAVKVGFVVAIVMGLITTVLNLFINNYIGG